MSQTIKAVFEKGVFRPLQEVHIKDHETVEIKIILRGEWENRFNRLVEKLHRETSQYSSEEIETDIAEAIREARAEKRGR